MPPIGSRPFQVYNKGEARSLGCAEGSIRMKTGLVLEGGGMRGMFTAGVLDAFYARGLHFDGVIGVSAGAVFGVNFLSRQPGRVIRYNKRYIRDPRYMGPAPLLRTGNLFSPDFAYGTVPTELDPFDQQSFQASGVPFYAVVTNIETGHAEYPLIENVFEQMDTLRASASLPFVSRPVAVGDGLYLDGGIVDSIPFEAMRALGYDRLVVVLTRDGSYRKGPMPSLPIDLWYGKYPALQQRLRCRHEAYNQSLDRLRQLEQDGVAKVIRPRHPIEMGRLERDPAVLQRVYDQGYAVGQKTEL